MARISKASTMNDSSPGVPSRRYTSQPSVTKEDIQKVKEEIVLAEKMVKIAVKTHEHKTLEHEQVILKKIRESREFQTKVKAFRRELLAKGALLPQKSRLGKKLALDRIKTRVNGFKAGLQREMLKEKKKNLARQSQMSLQVYKSSAPLRLYRAATSLTPEERKKWEMPRKPSAPRPVSSMEKLTTALGERVALELSPTGFAYFPRYHDNNDDWEHVSQHSVSMASSRKQAQETQQVQRDEKKTVSLKSMCRGLFGGK